MPAPLDYGTMAQMLNSPYLTRVNDPYSAMKKGLLDLPGTEGARPYGGGANSVRAYHGTQQDIGRFEATDRDMIDRMVGPHFAADPTLASKFAEGIYNRNPNGGRVYPVDIQNANKFLTVNQPQYDWAKGQPPGPRNVTTDQTAIERLIGIEGYKARPDLLERYLIEARRFSPQEAAAKSKALVKGETVDIEGKPTTLEGFVNNFGARPYNVNDRVDLVKAARDALQSKGYAGLRYINTSPTETEGVSDPTSYIPFPGNVSSRFGGNMYGIGLAALLGGALRKKKNP